MTPLKRHRQLLLAGLFAVLLLSPGVARAEGDPAAHVVATRGGEVWSASMRVGFNRGLGGYSTVSERGFGRLSGDTFSWRGVTYTVTNIIQNRSRNDTET